MVFAERTSKYFVSNLLNILISQLMTISTQRVWRVPNIFNLNKDTQLYWYKSDIKLCYNIIYYIFTYFNNFRLTLYDNKA